MVLIAGLWVLADRTIHDAERAATRDAVDVDLAGLVDIHASGGRAELLRRIDDRLASAAPGRSQPHYLVSDDRGTPIAGDLARWPDLDPRTSEMGMVRVLGGVPVMARATQLAPDLRLVVAYETGQSDPLRRRIALVFFAGGALFVALMGLLGRQAALRLQTRIGSINAAFRAPETVQAIEPVADARRSDEIDELAQHSNAALERMRRLVDAYRETSDQIAHEIRTPLMHLDRRLVKVLADPLPDAATDRLVEAREQIRRLVAMLEALLDIAFSKVRKGDRHGLQPVDLSALATRICDLYADSAEESGHRFAWSIAPDVWIAGEESQLSRLIVNLLDNAFKYVPAGGMIELSLEPGPVLIVADDGPGIAADERERIFERFYRGAGEPDGTMGSGLGLALARAIAERHGLAITLQPAQTGARFRVGEGPG